MNDINIAMCPFLHNCTPNCMLFLESSKVVCGPINVGEGNCAFAVLASHIASEEHSGGNYLMRTIAAHLGGEQND